jgi:2-polyprenyl-3-methyl-5-hydroxy-6-metoxy-1,4-benzoquinol methylase
MKKDYTDDLGRRHRGEILLSKDGFEIMSCETCGFIHITPYNTEENQKTFYQEGFYQEQKSGYIESHTRDKEWWTVQYNEKLDFFEKHLSAKNSRLLDIGSGPGYFLDASKSRGWECIGIEPGGPAYQFSTEILGLQVVNDFFDKNTYNKLGRFDVIHLNNVLEHINDPIEMIKLAYEILNPGGILCVSSPNDFNPIQKILVERLKKDHWWVVPRHHVNYFTFESLEKTLVKSGLSVLKRSSSFPLEIFALMGFDYIGNNDLGAKVHSMRKLLDESIHTSSYPHVLGDLYRVLAEIGIGREITIFSQKS